MSIISIRSRFLGCVLGLALSASASLGQKVTTVDFRRAVDEIAQQALKESLTPSAAVAVVINSQVAYVRSYGIARVDGSVTATPQMRYSLGSVSKQFTAAALLKLQESGKLSLDDPISRFLPSLTHAPDITIRQLLSHTSGYRDYWPQDYVPPFMLQPLSPQQILNDWARRPLDFEPGTQWQYSNTGFVAAALIVEKASGQPLMQFLQENIFGPAGMTEVANVDDGPLAAQDAAGYLRYALGPLHTAPKEARGWLFGAAELGMTAEDLARWDVSLIRQQILQPASYRQMETETLLKNGRGTQYGLGISIKSISGHRALEHGGEVSGFSAENLILPDDGVAVAVLTNQDLSAAPSAIAHNIAALLIPESAAIENAALQQAQAIFADLQKGQLDRSQLSGNANSYFTAQAIQDFHTSLAPLGRPLSFLASGQQQRGGMTYRGFIVEFPKNKLQVWVRVLPDGKIEQYQVAAAL
jgi:D-alanyl-D-alanine carboxypeptidase